MKKSEELTKKLTYSRQNFWEKAEQAEQDAAFAFAENYKHFLDDGKTERESAVISVEALEKAGFCALEKAPADCRKVYTMIHGKNVLAAVIGKQALLNGVNVVASHIDSPRVDLKQSPLYEDGETKMAMMRTHYYGGIKKYQWFSTPLALHGVVINQEGQSIHVSIGDAEDDPVFVMPDLLPHLAHKVQAGKKIGEALEASQMNVVFGALPFISDDEDDNVKEAVKLKALELLYEKYGFTEGDFLSAELELVPAGKARDCGLDKSMVLGYGQDDRICAYTSLQAIIEMEPDQLERTAIIYLADKEEIGSEGNTGAQSIALTDFVGDLLKFHGEDYSSYAVRKTFTRSQILSSDVNAAINPNFPSVHEKSNAVHLGFGVGLTKYTGVRGKGGSNDANAEFMAKIIRIFNQDNVFWQTGTLGKVDEGGGGTIAKFLAQLGAEVIDCGPGLLGMHSLYELCSKADLYSTYRCYKAFFQKA